MQQAQAFNKPLFYRQQCNKVSQQIAAVVANSPSDRLNQAVSYCLANSGKMLRSALVFAFAEVLQFDNQTALVNMAASIELIHTYSLVHDDLPAMDDDDIRRGAPTVHKKFDDATAILVGDCLQCCAFEVLSADCQLPAKLQLEMISILSKQCGHNGLIAGQMLDLYPNATVSATQLQQKHLLKTGALFQTTAALPAIASRANTADKRKLLEFAKHLGLAFQIADDILDVKKSTEQLGKPEKSDLNNNIATYASLLGVPQSKTLLNEHYELAVAQIQGLSCNKGLLNITQYIKDSVQ